MIKAIVTDIEGTTSSISFVKEVLFPYAYDKIGTYLQAHENQPEIQKIIQQVQQELQEPEADLHTVIRLLRHWINTDQKKTSLKKLQGYIWETGYKEGDYQAHMYPDATQFLTLWSTQRPLYVYSSGSVKAQDLFFSYSKDGNIKSLFKGFFDTTTGPKKEYQSYVTLSKAIQQQAHTILFLSDCPEEIKAAQKAEFQTCLINREPSIHCKIAPSAHSFDIVDQMFNLTQ